MPALRSAASAMRYSEVASTCAISDGVSPYVGIKLQLRSVCVVREQLWSLGWVAFTTNSSAPHVWRVGASTDERSPRIRGRRYGEHVERCLVFSQFHHPDLSATTRRSIAGCLERFVVSHARRVKWRSRTAGGYSTGTSGPIARREDRASQLKNEAAGEATREEDDVDRSRRGLSYSLVLDS
jgi:hypothetical protein